MSRLQVDENRIEWADTEQMVEFKKQGNDMVVYIEKDYDYDTKYLTLDIPIGDFFHLLSELRKKFS